MINYFWAKKTGNFWMSNFYPAEIEYEGKVYPTSEHLYQGLKCSEHWREEVRKCKSPKEAKILAHEKGVGNQVQLLDLVKLMRKTIRLKFDQHPDLKEKLLDTTGMIVEASPYDSRWGYGEDKEGLNLMGLLLVELREYYVSELADEIF